MRLSPLTKGTASETFGGSETAKHTIKLFEGETDEKQIYKKCLHSGDSNVYDPCYRL